MHGQVMVRKAEADVEKDGLVDVESVLFAINNSRAKTIAYESVVGIKF